MTPEQWNKALAPEVPWPEAYAVVEREVRALLTAERGCVFATAEVVQEIYQEHPTSHDPVGMDARRRIFKALRALATRGLKDCCTKGEPEPSTTFAGRTIQRWRWHAPHSEQLSEHGNGVGPIAATFIAAATPTAPIRCPRCGHRL